ncbi:hypothetical protein [Streptomyces sp. NPDC005435]|uniref:hypothetical protein n=1 Tax=Streptomyces sp. NPDC005435 TaxID=3154464 RepID=UPI0034536DC8
MPEITPQTPLTPARARALLAMLPAGTEIEPGLTDRELDAVESHWGFRFAPEHRTLLSAGLPTGPGWPDWRDGAPEDLAERLAWPVEGVLSDVECDAYWHTGWGPRPEASGQAREVAAAHLTEVPRMIPVHSHRYLPGDPDRVGAPVLSMYQTDIVCYGGDLAGYFHNEFGGLMPTREDQERARQAAIPFWSGLVG